MPSLPRRLFAAALAAAAVLPSAPAVAAPDAADVDEVVDLHFPVQTPVNYDDTWRAARSGGRTHEGLDIMAGQMQQVYAATAGTIHKAWGEGCEVGEYCDAFSMLVHGDDGRSYFYIHLNDDTPGRPDGCDHVGGMDNAFSPRLVAAYRERGTLVGVRVERGEHLGYVGSSGNASCAIDHLHFEIHADQAWGREAGKVNPFASAEAAIDAGRHWGRAGVPDVTPADTARLAGPTRVETAAQVALSAFDAADQVVLAPSGLAQPALVGSVLASPVLLTGQDRLPAATLDALDALGASRVLVLSTAEVGGRVDRNVDDELLGRGLAVRRVEADDVLSLAVAVAAHAEATGRRDASATVLLARGVADDPSRSWPDALAAAQLAAARRAPLLLTRQDQLGQTALQWLVDNDVQAVDVVGGPAAVSDDVAAQLADVGIDVRRLAGPDRFATAVAVADAAVAERGLGADGPAWLATGRNWPDAVTAGPAAARLGVPLLLVEGQQHLAATATDDWLAGWTAPAVWVLGGDRAVAPMTQLRARYHLGAASR